MGHPTYEQGSVFFASPVAAAQVFNVEASLAQGRPCDVYACWWDVQVWGWGNEQTVGAGGGTGPIPDPGFLQANGQRSVPILARVKYEGRIVDFDVGAGMRLAIYARVINLTALAPAGSVEVRGGTGAVGLINTSPVAPIQQQNSLVYGQVAQVEAPIGQRVAKLTQTVSIAGAGQTVNIPAGARRVRVFQNTAGGAPAPMNWQTNVLSAIDLGQIDFIAGNFHTQLLDVPGDATIIAPGAAVRVLTFVWELEL